MQGMAVSVRIQEATKRFGDNVVVNRVSLDTQPGEFGPRGVVP